MAEPAHTVETELGWLPSKIFSSTVSFSKLKSSSRVLWVHSCALDAGWLAGAGCFEMLRLG